MNVVPALPPERKKSYVIAQPEATHFKRVSCSDIDCGTQASGFIVRVDEAVPFGQKQAFYLRHHSGRSYSEHNENGLTEFVFPPGSECFDNHDVAIREPVFIVKGGDWRGNPRGDYRVHDTPDHWVEDFSEHQNRLARS